MAQQPSRPFESLAWYRDAARNGFRDEQPDNRFVAWLLGAGLLQAHISVYALGIVALYSINLIRDPGESWAERWILAWTILVLIHAVVVGLLWALRQWNADEPDEPLLMARRPMGPAWAMPPAESAAAQEATFRVNAPVNEPVEAAPWSDWSGDVPGPEIPASERASWSEAAAAAWLDRTGQLTPPSEGNDETSKSE